jgi:hypothetical protein
MMIAKSSTLTNRTCTASSLWSIHLSVSRKSFMFATVTWYIAFISGIMICHQEKITFTLVCHSNLLFMERSSMNLAKQKYAGRDFSTELSQYETGVPNTLL